MDNIFKGQEILKLAIRVEINGFEFYKEVAGIIKDSSIQETFNYLSGEEVKHKTTFESMLKTVGDYAPVENYPGEYDAHLKHLAGENIFTKEGTSKVFAYKVSSEEAAIRMGIGLERDSIIFFSEMKNLLPSDTREVIDRVIQEENDHLAKLVELKNNIQ